MSDPLNAVPLRIGTDAEFAALQNALNTCGYTESEICQRFDLRHVSEFQNRNPAPAGGKSTDPVWLLVKLFIEGDAVRKADASNLPLRELNALGLIAPHPADAERIVATTMLYPIHGLLVASDRKPLADISEKPLEDIVYSALVPNSSLFVDLIPKTSCDALLDLCAGTGIGAMVAARNGAKHAWSCDVTERATHFAEFNRRLNEIINVTPLQGDLYEAVSDRTFDRIVSHPPYLPVYRRRFVFDSGGQDGEQIVRRVIEGLPRYLRPGGRFYALMMGSDREQPFEQRLREWLGEAEREFDIAFVVHKTMTPREYSADAVVAHKGQATDIAGWRELFREWDVRTLVYGLLVIQRREHDRPTFTVRRESIEQKRIAECAWLVEWETAALDPARLLSIRPRARQNVRLHVQHGFIEGSWQPESYHLETNYPFETKMRIEPWAAHLLIHADGSRTVEALLHQLKEDGAVNPATPALEFTRAVAMMISAGLVEIEEFKLPEAQ